MNDHSDILVSPISSIRDGNYQKALEQIQSLLEINPADTRLLVLMGACYSNLGEKPGANACWEWAISMEAGRAEAYNKLGIVLRELGLGPDAEAQFVRSLQIDPDLAGANYNLGNMLRDRGQFLEAELAYRRALAKSPTLENVSHNLGNVLFQLGKLSDAAIAYQNALAIKPDRDTAHNLGTVLFELGHLSRSEEAFRYALAIDQNSAITYIDFARVLYRASRYDEAEATVRRAIELNPLLAEAYLVLGTILDAKNSGNIDLSLDAYRQAIELDPDCMEAHSNLIYALMFRDEDELGVLAQGRAFLKQFEAPYIEHHRTYKNERSLTRRLRIGYVSPDFRDHCQSNFMTPLLENHDRRAVEIYCYSSVQRPDAFTDRLSGLADVWRDVRRLDDHDLAAVVENDRIDILVDLTMHMAGGRPLLFARRPAPVQVAWLAYPGTSAMATIDYRLTDPLLDSRNASGTHGDSTEQLIWLPDTFWCFDPMMNEMFPGPLPADRNRHITFGCLNSPRKMTIRTMQLWARILNQIAGSRMILLVANGDARKQVSSIFEELGVDPARLVFFDYQSREKYFATYQEIDISLDTFPYNGHTTSLDSFWMGAPVITQIGTAPAGRAGLSILSNLRLSELAARSDEEFVDIACRLASDRTRLRNLRADLRQRMERSPLMDYKRFAQGMETAYRQMWKNWCASTA
jgi:predicted O-linked N-acetylglucosamine transferase (SPINDLY family)